MGLGIRETPLESSICAHAILQPGLLEVHDLKADARFRLNPLVTSGQELRFYAGALLQTPEGYALGTICVLDTKPRTLSLERQETLFNAFHQEDAASEGLGLGLSIVQRMVELLGYALRIFSVHGKGSRFSLEVPLAQPEPQG